MDQLAVESARAVVAAQAADAHARFGYLPRPQRELRTQAPTDGRIELVTRSSVLDYTDSQSGYKLTPDRLTWILRQADLGVPVQLFDLFEHVVLGDGHTRGLYEKRLDEMCVPWTWQPGDDRPASLQASEELDEATRAIDMDGAIEHIALAAFWGCSYAEVAWITRADGRQVPAEIVCVPHRRFMFDQESNPRLTSEANPYPGDALERRPGSSWLRAETRRWRKQTQAGILRTVAWWALFKRMSVRDWLIFAERFGIPMILGTAGPNASETTRAKLAEVIRALGTEGSAVLGDGATIQVLNQALRSGSGDHLHPAIVALANSEISKAITAGTLTADTGGPGSFALGQVHADSAHRLALAHAQRIGGVFRRDLALEYLIRNRLADRARPPLLHLHVHKPSLLADAQVLEKLVDSGLEVSKRQVHEHFGWRAPIDDTTDKLVPLASRKGKSKETTNGDDTAQSR